MKYRSHSLLRIAAALSLGGITFTHAADQFWNPSPLSNDWAGSVWSATSGGGSLGTWTAANDAVFDQAGTYTATINAAQTATNINIKAGTVTFAGTNTAASNNLTIDSGATLNTVGDRIAKAGTTQVTVNGTLDLTAGGFGGGRYIQLAGSGNIIGAFRHSGTASFSGNIDDVSVSSRAAIIWNAGTGGTFTLSGNNSGMSGDVLMSLNNSVIKLSSANALSSSSNLRFEGSTNSNLVELAAADFTRAWLTGSNVSGTGGINWSGTNAGFYATGGDRNLTFVTTTGGSTAASVVWNSNGLNSSTVVLGAAAGTHKLTWTNDIGLNGAVRTFNTGNGGAAVDAALSGVLSGTGASGITKTGAGTLESSGDNSYNGVTTVSSGTLLINGNSSTATGAVAVNGGTLGGTGRTGGAVTVAATATLSPGASIQSFDVASLAMQSNSVFAYEVSDNGTSGADLLASRGTLSLTGVTLSLDPTTLAALGGGGWAMDDKLTLISYLGADVTSGFTDGTNPYVDDTDYTFGSNIWRFNYNDTVAGNNFGGDAVAGGQNRFVTLTVVPEPNVAALIGAFGGLLLLRRRR